jgi:hypothetical protein
MHNQNAIVRGTKEFHPGNMLALCTIGLLVSLNGGCLAKMAAGIVYAIRGNDTPAEFDGLKDKRVALICNTSGAVASEAVTSMLTSNIVSSLNRNLPKADIVRQEEIDRVLEKQEFNDGDQQKLAASVRADYLVAVQVDNLKLRDGATLFRGQSDIKVTVYDMKNSGRIVFEKEIIEHSFPKNGGTPITDTTEARFRSAYLQLVGYRVASLFHPVDPTFDVALDATSSKF